MNERRQDFELLQRFTRDGEQSAFADVVRRHLDLVFATALRKVEDAEAAQEVAQNVFTVLARKAWQFAPDDSLPAWLHKAALLESKAWLRGELGRRRREQTAAELGTTMKTPEDQPAFHALVPLLDEALLSLREKDRTALLLRFYESQSLRDVGAAFGVSEDTARKRVQGALEKLAEFFNRRGIKTASVAAAAAALQHTAATTSAAVASTVVSAALKVAPPALVGLAALLARVASLSRVPTAAVCVALATVPVGLQLNEGRVAGRELRRIETQLMAGRDAAASLQSEIERLRTASQRLYQSVAQANEAAARAAADAQAFEDWKQRIRAPLLAADYRWSDDSPFVRIPKALLPALTSESGYEPFSSRGVVTPMGRELLGLTPSEQQAMEAALQPFADVDDRLAARIQETNLPVSGNQVAARSFVLSPPAAEELKPLHERALTELRGLVGEDRWLLVEAKPPEAGPLVGNSNPMRIGESVEAQIWKDDKGMLKVSLRYSVGNPSAYKKGVVSSKGTVLSENMSAGAWDKELSMFLPEDDPNRTAGLERFIEDNKWVSHTGRQRLLAWLREEAIARLGRKENP